jgi:hypothetical protein
MKTAYPSRESYPSIAMIRSLAGWGICALSDRRILTSPSISSSVRRRLAHRRVVGTLSIPTAAR